MHQKLLELIIGFDWDAGNLSKNWLKHGIAVEEAQEVFTNDDFILIPDARHSGQETRYAAFGVADLGRKIAIAFTIRNRKVRIIMARDMSRKERKWYEEEIDKNA